MRRRAWTLAVATAALAACHTSTDAPVAPPVAAPPPARKSAMRIVERPAVDRCGLRTWRRGPAVLEGRAADDTVVWTLDVEHLVAALPLPDGGMFVYSHPGGGAVSQLLEPDGRRAWGHRWPEPRSTHGGPPRRIEGPDPRTLRGLSFRGDELIMAFHEQDASGFESGVDVWTFSSTGEVLARRRVAAPEHLSIEQDTWGGIHLFGEDAGSHQPLDIAGVLLPRTVLSGAVSADPAAEPPEARGWLGSSDVGLDLVVTGSRISARDADGAERWAFGMSHAVAATAPAWRGTLVVDEGCQAVALDDRGGVRWWRDLGATSETCPILSNTSIASDDRAAVIQWARDAKASEVVALDRDGQIFFAQAHLGGASDVPIIRDGVASLCSTDRITPLPPLTRATAFPARAPTTVLEAKVEQHLDRPVDALAVLGPRDVAVLSGEHLLRWNGTTWRDTGPIVAPPPPPLTDPPAVAERFVPGRLARGPDGALWISGSRRVRLLVSDYGPSMPTYVGSMPVLLRERGGTTTAVKELADLLSEQGSAYDHVHVTSRGDEGAVCWLGACRTLRGTVASPVAMPDRGWSTSAVTVVDGEAWTLGDKLGHVTSGSMVATSVALERFEDYERTPRLWGSSAQDVWIVDAKVRRFDGEKATEVSVPVASPRDVWGTARDDVWIAGTDGAAHFDGARWSRVIGLGSPVLAWVSGAGPGDVWMGGSTGLFHVTSPGPLRSIASPAPPDAAREPVRAARPVVAPDPGFTRVSWRPNGRPPMTTALELATAGDALWVRDDEGVVEHRGGATTVIASRAAIGGSRCRQCLAPRAPGKGVVLGASAVFELGSGAPRRLDPRLASMLAIGVGTRGARIAGASDARGEPAAWWLDEAAPRWDVPPGCYVAIASPAHAPGDPTADEAWLAGGLRCTIDPGGQPWPAGEGILVHHTPTSVRWFRAPAGPLLDVVAKGPGEAWAVGVDGAVVHVRAGEVSRSRVEPPVRLHAVLAEGDAVWVAGDDRTLLRLAGDRAERVEITALPPGAALTSLARHEGALWIASPDGIVRGPRRR